MKHKIIAWIGLIPALAIILIGAGCERRTSVDNIVDDIPANNTIDNSIDNSINEPKVPPASGLPSPAIVLPDLIAETKEATDRVRSWVIHGKPLEDLELALVSSKFIDSLSDDGLDTNWYIFISGSYPNNYYLVNMPRKGIKPKRIMMPKTDFDFDFAVLPIPFDKWNVSYVDALIKAESLGGDDFRARHDEYETSVILAYPASGLQELNWSITYKATDRTGEQFRVQVNADTGEGLIVT
ncbi:MAG: hypothetical protein U9M89_00610 [Patescibacteria group bacterium]|nr:hypothetical protein [Patescibacteria group bacterium]